ncbi:MAG: hypothetical protein A2161_22080 [Candidatus Schekmanbacteria bacterium RBG_13_48_7]|uniref:Periplasmic heavy metal sensor n=1 Tax=Candidatus Schekmanbacteria bacterium RBG_13_48_7 TaxID=1817878 RepID=A0A1F7RYL9_9BACT|nr:MAG: hypothetical protein A2161_22080 [Candidatus Schekmanbacteria bacterium RBG_13_48_7]
MKKNLFILFLILLMIINITALTTIAYQRYKVGRHDLRTDRPGMGMRNVNRMLGLNDMQAKEFESEHEKLNAEIEQIQELLEQKRTALLDEMMILEPDMSKINKLIEDTGNLQTEIKKKTTMHILKLKTFLNPQQQKKFFETFRQNENRRARRLYGEFLKGPRNRKYQDKN